MQRINSDDGLFHDGDPFNGVQGTMVTADWLNAQQEELASVIEAAGLALDPGDNAQLLAALVALIGLSTAALGNSAVNYFLSEN